MKPLGTIADIRVSNVDKKVDPAEVPVKLCNYMDVYSNTYITNELDFMAASASRSEIERLTLVRGDVVITKDSETPDDIGIPAVLTDDIKNLVCGYHLALIRPDSGQLDPVFLAKQLATAPVACFFGQRASGSTRYGLPKSAIESVVIPTPPKLEQEKIAEVLSTIDRAIAQTEALIAKETRLGAGLMQDLLTSGVDVEGKMRSEKTHEFSESSVGNMPVEWHEGGLLDYVVADAGIKPGPFGSSLTKDMYVDTGYRVYGQEQVIGGSLEIGNYFVTGRKFVEMSAFAVQAADVLISLVGTTGHVLVVPQEHHPGIINPRLLRLRPHPKRCVPEFLKALLLSKRVRAQLDALATGGTMTVLSGGIVRKLRVPIVPLDEQARIVRVASSLEATRRCLDADVSKLKAIRAGLMQDLLTGRRRVTALLEADKAEGQVA